jgi:hypothetical protein
VDTRWSSSISSTGTIASLCIKRAPCAEIKNRVTKLHFDIRTKIHQTSTLANVAGRHYLVSATRPNVVMQKPFFIVINNRETKSKETKPFEN